MAGLRKMSEAARGESPVEGGPGAASPVLVVALDVPSADAALTQAENLRGLPVWLKVGLELFTAEGPELVRRLTNLDYSLFLDLKFYDIPNTVHGAMCSATMLGAHMATLHISGGEAMCRAAVAGRRRGLEESRRKNLSSEPAPGKGPLLMGVTVLTSQGGREEDIRSTVVERARLAREWGLDGVVCSGWEAAAVKSACGRDFFCLCPGIRFAGFAGGDDQARICTPGQAVAAGADFLVMGRPITGAKSPVEAARAALEQMGKASRT